MVCVFLGGMFREWKLSLYLFGPLTMLFTSMRTRVYVKSGDVSNYHQTRHNSMGSYSLGCHDLDCSLSVEGFINVPSMMARNMTKPSRLLEINFSAQLSALFRSTVYSCNNNKNVHFVFTVHPYVTLVYLIIYRYNSYPHLRYNTFFS